MKSREYLHKICDNPFARDRIAQTAIPKAVTDNLKFDLRPYQEEALKRFIYTDNHDFEGKPEKPLHLLYNMATGSGKTLVMAGLMLYLYEKGQRNFLFFVNSNNIIKKSKDNFLNLQASKYLFQEKVIIAGREALIKEVENFEEADTENINLKFTTIQQLHLDLKNTKENSITIEDFRERKIVLIADEAHHLSAATRNDGDLFDSWEGTVMELLKANPDNILLEFTATIDHESRQIAEKYREKLLYRYDLAQFRSDGYSKEISLVRSLYDEKERIMQALILNLYRQELAARQNINLKPVILFKARRTIAESERNKVRFHQLIDNLSADMIEHIQKTSTVPIVQKAFHFFENRGLSGIQIAKRIRSHFKRENCFSANSDAEAALNQIRLNTLEDENNPIRAIFAVKKLDEGWDVLNLFDIVRLYEGQDGRSDRPGKTTISEAQLIGRGARYFPFALEEGQDSYTRKFDKDVSSDLRVLEELYYHAKEDSKYISELKRALIQSGIYDDNLETRQLRLKPAFKETDFYKRGHLFFKKRAPKNYFRVRSFADLGVRGKNISYDLSSGLGQIATVFDQEQGVEEEGAKEEENENKTEKIEQKEISLSNIPSHIIRYALSQNSFYYFNNLQRYFPKVGSLSSFMESSAYLGALKINFRGPKRRLSKIDNQDYLRALQRLLEAIETEIKSNLTEYEGSDYIKDYIQIDTGSFLITGVPLFYSSSMENKFKRELETTLDLRREEENR